VEAGVSGQFFACYVEPQFIPYQALERTLQLADQFYGAADSFPELMIRATGPDGIWKAHREGKVAGILTVEGGEALQGSLAVLRALYRLGVRALTLTWNFRNALADGVDETRTGGGLSNFGVEVVREMGRLGMLVDVSHLTEAGFWQVMEEARGPVVATHSNARAVCDHRRNLTDEQLKALAAKGGVTGLNAAPGFVTKDAYKTGPDGRLIKATISALLDHADHIIGLVGPDHVGLGLDLDGISRTPEDFEDVTCLPLLTQGLFERGHSAETVRAILGGNFLRAMDEAGVK
jgi:membrane dipeptidase